MLTKQVNNHIKGFTDFQIKATGHAKVALKAVNWDISMQFSIMPPPLYRYVTRLCRSN